MNQKPPIRILLVDDSRVSLDILREALQGEDDLRVVGEALNGRQAVEMVETLRPDIVCIDLDMPVMTGTEAIDEIMHRRGVPILVVSGADDAGKAYEALSLGALEVIRKPRFNTADARDFVNKIRLLAGVPVITRMRRKLDLPGIYDNLAGLDFAQQGFRRIVAIACSTGGPQALSFLLARLDDDFPAPVLVSQHMSDGFVDGMVQWLSGFSRLPIKVAQQGELLVPKQVYISPSERHLTVDHRGRVCLRERQPGDIYRPCCNYLLESVAQTFTRRAIGLIMTGMGRDGAAGMLQLKNAGGITLAQDEASSVIFGMNQEAINQRCIDEVLSLNEVPCRLNQLVRE